MRGRKRADVLLVGQTPPPYHGQAVVTALVFGHDWGEIAVARIRMAYSSSIEVVGSVSLRKIGHLFSLIARTWKQILVHRPRVLYYLPASPGMVPVIRDLVYLLLVRWFFQRIVFHYHAGGLDGFVAQRPWLRGIARLAYGRADVSIEVNEWLRPTGLYFAAKKNVTIPNGVMVERVDRKRAMSEPFQLIYVGMLCEEKGVSEMVEMMGMLSAKGFPCELLLVGDWVSEDYKRTVLEEVANEGLSDLVQWAGVLHGTAKWQAYADADCFVFPSHHPTETFGLVVVEAMAFGLPIVTTRWRGIPTVVGNEGGAILCDVQSPSQYANAVQIIHGDRVLRERMGNAARQRYESAFTQTLFLERMKAEFSNLLQR